jgi:tetratricopeptide (TPR) repeat protein
MRRIPIAAAALAVSFACATGTGDWGLDEAYRAGDPVGDLDGPAWIEDQALAGHPNYDQSYDHDHSANAWRIVHLTRSARELESEENYAEAEELYRQALDLSLVEYGHEDPDTADRINNVGAVVHKRGRYVEAEAYYREGLAIYEEALEADHLRATTTMVNLGMLDRVLGHDAEAVDLIERALAVRERELGPESLQTAITLNLLGLAYADEGRLEEAQTLLERSLELRTAALGPEHTDTASTLNDLGVLALRRGDLEVAERHLDQAREIRESLHGTVALQPGPAAPRRRPRRTAEGTGPDAPRAGGHPAGAGRAADRAPTLRRRRAAAAPRAAHRRRVLRLGAPQRGDAPGSPGRGARGRG